MPDVRYANLLEPEALVELFLRHPPQGFAATDGFDLGTGTLRAFLTTDAGHADDGQPGKSAFEFCMDF